MPRDDLDELAHLRREQDEDRRLAVSFFSGDSLDKFWMFTTLQLEIRLMDHFLLKTEVAWEIKQLRQQQAGTRRSYPLVELHRAASEPAGLLRQFTTACTHRLENADLWINMPHQERYATYIYIALARAATVAYQLLIVRWRAEELLQTWHDTPCMVVDHHIIYGYKLCYLVSCYVVHLD